MEKVEIRKIIEDIIITQFLNSEMDIVHEEDVTFKELGLDSLDQIELEMMVEQKFNIVIIDYDMETIKDLTAVRTVPVISLTMLSRPSLRHWESLISFRLQIL